MTTKTLVDTDTAQLLSGKNVNGAKNLLYYGAGINDGVVNVTPYWNTAMAEIDASSPANLGGTILIPPGRYLFATQPSMITSDRVTVLGLGGVTLIKGFSGDLFRLFSMAKFLNLEIDGGYPFTGSIWTMGASTFGQEIAHCYVRDAADGIIMYEDAAGTFSSVHDCVFYIDVSSALGSVVKRTVSTRDTAAGPRIFASNQCVGPNTKFCDANGFFTAYFTDIYSGGIQLGNNSLGCTIHNCRMAILSTSNHPSPPNGHPAIVLSGNSTMVSGCEIGGDLTIDGNFIYGHFTNNTMDPDAIFTDNSIKTGIASQPIVEEPRYAAGRQVQIIPTANIQAAGALMNGRVFIEDAGVGSSSIVFYKGGQRFRLTGTLF